MAADSLPPKPARYFNDYAGVVPAATANRLNDSLASFERSNSSQIVVAIFDKLPANAALEDFTVRTAQSWRVGQKEKDNGAVLFVFVQDRQLRIEVGYGLEGALPDAMARRIIENEITPRFRQGDYGGGVSAGVTALMQAVRGEYKGTGRTVGDNSRGRGRIPGGLIAPLIFLIVLTTIIRRIGTSFHHGRRSYWGSGWSGGGGGGFSGGGGGGFSGGGGSFGGGGASGRW